jgi:hypothetical protein
MKLISSDYLVPILLATSPDIMQADASEIEVMITLV